MNSVNYFVLLQFLVVFASGNQYKDKRQITRISESQNEPETAETGFGANLGGHGKYFQYAHVPQKDHYEHGHRKGNEHHFNERHEKAHPHEGEFKTKVKWGDKHGGYGEHYWDYNHAGDHHDGNGEESQAHPEYETYETSSSNQQQINEKPHQFRGKRNQQRINSEMKLVFDTTQDLLIDEITGKTWKVEPLF